MLRQRCLKPGLYYDHLTRWLDLFSRNQIMMIHSELFKRNPYFYLDKMQEVLKFQGFSDYKNKLTVRKFLRQELESLEKRMKPPENA